MPKKSIKPPIKKIYASFFIPPSKIKTLCVYEFKKPNCF
jgi:hypothetical protein